MRKGWLTAAVLIGVLPASAAEGPNPRLTPIVQAVQKTRPAIVAIQVEKKGSGADIKETIGTGVIVDAGGYIVTSDHLVHTATRVRVKLSDGSEWPAEIVVEDKDTDLAVIRVKTGKQLPVLPLGAGDDLLVGETVIAIGHPYGCGYTVSRGIIRALGQEITMPSGAVLSQLIQTDASINPGNSGGPLLNINGEWIGLTVALRENARGIAYAHNIDTVARMLSGKLGARR